MYSLVESETVEAMIMKSSASRRVTLATEVMVRSSQRMQYGNDGMSLMWMPPTTYTRWGDAIF
jgi:hypothetical protein